MDGKFTKTQCELNKSDETDKHFRIRYNGHITDDPKLLG